MIGTIAKTLMIIMLIGGVFWAIQAIVWSRPGTVHESEAQKTIQAEDIETIIEEHRIASSIVKYIVFYYEEGARARNGMTTRLDVFKGWIWGENIKKFYEVKTISESDKPRVEIYRAKRRSFLWHNEDFTLAKREYTILYIPDMPSPQSQVCVYPGRSRTKRLIMVTTVRYNRTQQDVNTC